jgi:hypothetical protein
VAICTEDTRMTGYRLSFVSTDIPVHLLLHATCSVSPPRFPCCSSIPCSSSFNSFPCCYFSFPTTLLLTIGIRAVRFVEKIFPPPDQCLQFDRISSWDCLVSAIRRCQVYSRVLISRFVANLSWIFLLLPRILLNFVL